MPWNPPPRFVADETVREQETSSESNGSTRRTTPTTTLKEDRKIKSLQSYGKDLSGSNRSIAWMPPPYFVNPDHRNERPSFTSVNAERNGESNRNQNERNPARKIRERSNDLSLRLAPSDDATIGLHQQSEYDDCDEHQQKSRANFIFAFKPFRNAIARCVLRHVNMPTMSVDIEEGKSDGNVDEGDDRLLQIMEAAMDHEETTVRIDRESTVDYGDIDIGKPPSVSQGEYFSFMEGVRMTVCASSRLAMALSIKHRISKQQNEIPISSSGDDSSPSNVKCMPPGRFQSMRAMSIARARKRCEEALLSHHHISSVEPENGKTHSASLFTRNDEPDRSPSNKGNSAVLNQNGRCDNILDENVAKDQGNAREIQKLLEDLEEAEKYQRRLEQQLKKAGVVIAEDIPYATAKQKVADLSSRMVTLHNMRNNPDSDVESEYFKLEQEMDKYVTALELTEEWIEEQAEEERKWEESIKEDNEASLRMILKHMPVDVKNRSELQLRQEPTPNGKYLPRAIALRFKRTNCLQLLRTDPEEMIKWHPSMFENLRVTGLTLTERRALHHHLKILGKRWKDQSTNGGNKMLERKLDWFATLQSNFKESLSTFERHVEMYGPPGNHCSCPFIGRQCPLKANKVVDYSCDDYGYPEESIFLQEKRESNPSESSTNKTNHRICGANGNEDISSSSPIHKSIPLDENKPKRLQLLNAIQSNTSALRCHGRVSSAKNTDEKTGASKAELFAAIHAGRKACID